uniref:Uncharacterized protein n=1 Tax=Knipowitschia caucasica TaxID=637954 RepID=A0AAV2J9P0_KNICA
MAYEDISTSFYIVDSTNMSDAVGVTQQPLEATEVYQEKIVKTFEARSSVCRVGFSSLPSPSPSSAVLTHLPLFTSLQLPCSR